MSWSSAERGDVVKLLAVVVEVTGAELSAAAARLMVDELQRYPAPRVSIALRRCASECYRRVTLADIVERIPVGQPVLSAAATRKMLDERLAVPKTSPAERAEILQKVKGLAGKMGGTE